MENVPKRMGRVGRKKNAILSPSPIQLYVDKHNMTIKHFASKCKLGHQSAYRFYHGQQPSYLLAKRIAAKTNQEITMGDMNYYDDDR